jgi:hypothetical protein
MGSVSYFYQGHNFSFGRDEYIDAINALQSLLDVGLWDAILNEFEQGVIVPVDSNPVDYIKNHSVLPKSKLKESINGKNNGHGKWWEDQDVVLKMYDPKYNFRYKVGLARRKDIVGYDPDLDYLKFESHYKAPQKLVNNGYLSLEDLQCPDRILHLNDVLLSQYQRLYPMKTLIKPTDKGSLKYQEIVTMKLVEVLMNQGMNIYGAQKEVYRFMDQFECLSKPDKDKRKATARKVFAGLQVADVSQWDLSADIEEVLAHEC